MSYAPAFLLGLRTYLQGRTGLSPVSLGIVGDAAHARRASYHNGLDRFLAFDRTRATDYSFRTARDWNGRSNAAMAMDIGNFSKLRSLSVHLVAQCRRNAPGTIDIREVIYSPDGRTVLRWDRERGFSSAPRTGEADSSHLWHTHVSWYRDSERRSKLAPFKAYFQPADVPTYSAKIDSGRPGTMTYNSLNVPVGEVSGLTVITGPRISIAAQWRFKILSGKYAGRYLPATGTVTYTRL